MNIKITNAVKHLLIINVLFFLVRYTAFGQQFFDLMAMHFIENPLFKPWQVITHLFMHGSEMHLLFNMLVLWMFGSAVEGILGTKNFLILYFVAGLGAVLFSLGIDWFQFQSLKGELIKNGMSANQFIELVTKDIPYGQAYTNETYREVYRIFQTSLVGASGALYGVMVAFGVLMPKAKMGLIFLPIMIEARIFIPLILLYDMGFGIFRASDGIGHFAHIGGAITGFLMILYLKKYTLTRWN